MKRDGITGKIIAKNRLGERHGIFVVIGDTGKKDNNGSKIWLAKCDCGNEFEVPSGRISRKYSCGCEKKPNSGTFKAKEIVGLIINDVEAIRQTEDRDNSGYVIYEAECKLCGKIQMKASYDFARGTVRCDCEEWKLKFGKPLGRKPDPDNLSNVNRVFKQYKKSAKERNLSFELTKKQFKSLIEADCFYCGKKPQRRNRTSTCHGEYYCNGIDRMNNSIGYTVENCVTCCSECNFGKGTMSKQDFLNWVKRVYEHTFSAEKEEVMP